MIWLLAWLAGFLLGRERVAAPFGRDEDKVRDRLEKWKEMQRKKRVG